MKRCPKCHSTKSKDKWYRNRSQPSGLSTWCKTCTDKKNRAWHAKNRQKIAEYQRGRYLLRAHGMKDRDWVDMFLRQAGQCAICSRKLTQAKSHIDHDHLTNRRRGLLCPQCNKAIGLLGDDIDTIRKALEYLEFHTAKAD